MTSIEKKLNSLIYPIYGHIRWEIEHAFCGKSLRFSYRSSDKVKIGKIEWYLLAVHDTLTEVLGIGLETDSRYEGVKIHRVLRLINQQGQGEDKVYESDFKTPSSRDDHTFIKRSELISGGFVKDGKIIVEYSVRIDSEDGVKRRDINFRVERPNEDDLKIILEKRELPETVEKYIEIPFSSLKKGFIEEFTLFGLPATLTANGYHYSIYLRIRLNSNSDEESDWWRCSVHTQFMLVNHDDEKLSLIDEFYHTYRRSYTGASGNGNQWYPFVDAKGFVKDGKLTLKCTFRVLEWFGFDEKTNRGIEKPMRRMTDVGLKVCWKKYIVAKKVLAQQSYYFRYLFDSNPDQSEFKIENIEPEVFLVFLEIVHNVDTDICEENVEGVLEVIKRFKAPECFERFALVLKRKEFKNPMKVLDWLDKYPLPGLKDDDFVWSIQLSRKFMRMSYEEKKEILDKIWRRNESIREEQTTDFKEETDLTDVKIEVDDHIYYASKQILSNASYFFMKRFYGPYSTDETIISDLDVSSSNFELLLTHIYRVWRDNFNSLLQLAHQFSVFKLMDKCEEYLVLNDSVSLDNKLKYTKMYDLPYLEAACHNKTHPNQDPSTLS